LLTALDLTQNTLLTAVWCNGNQLTFATLPSISIGWYIYTPQDPLIVTKDIIVGNELDLSSQYSVNGTITVYSWRTKEGSTLVENTDYTISEGKTTFLNQQTDSVYCIMTNAVFSAFNTYAFKTTLAKVLLAAKQNQTITFNSLPGKKVNDAPFIISATATSGLPVTFSSSDTSIASVTGNTVTLKKAGAVIITVTQAGNDMWSPAIAKQTLTITATTENREEKKDICYVYPNPTTDILHFKGEGTENIEIAIYNLQGTKVWRGVAKEQSVNISLLPSGVYILKMNGKSKEEERIIRFIKQ
jgi:hypothetical protein